MAIADAAGLPIAAHMESASPHEVILVEATIDDASPSTLQTGSLEIRPTIVMDLIGDSLRSAALN